MLAERMKRVSLSPTLRMGGQAAAMRGQGIDVVDLSVGEPDFPTPANVKEAGKRAIDENFTKYTMNAGIPELRAAIREKLERDQGLEYAPDEILVSAGAKNSLYNLAVALFGEGDEVIVPAPYWVTYPDQVKLAGAEPVVVAAREENGFRLTADDLRHALTPRTKALILNTPSNPTGAAYPRQELEALAAIAVEKDLVVISDEIYEKLVYDGFSHVSIASLGPEVQRRTVVVNGLSKAYSMTGWRLGYAAGPREIIAAAGMVQSHNTSNAPSIAQKAAVEALNGPQDALAHMVAEFGRRREAMVQRLCAIPGVSCPRPQGAFYVFPNVARHLGRRWGEKRIAGSFDLSMYLLEQAHVAVVPGDAFGAEGYIRLSYATSMERIEEGVRRIAQALERLEPAA